MQGHLRKMLAEPAQPVAYSLVLAGEGEETRLALGPRLGTPLRLQFSGTIRCIACGRATPKSYSQGHCYPCSQRLAACDLCIVKPEQCHYAQGTCREPAWGEAHCMRPHVVYLANSSGLKVGITRLTQVPTRWLDQGASQALPMLRVATRYQSGRAEVVFKRHISDRTDWRKLLRGDPAHLDLAQARDQLLRHCATDLADLRAEFGDAAIQTLPQETVREFRYPVRQYPAKIQSLDPVKTPVITGCLLGVKGQYLILDSGVINVRKFSGYHVVVE